MASALSALANASVTLQVPGVGVTTDPTTGNVAAVTSTTTISLFLRAEKLAYTPYPGVDVVDTVYEGYAVDPQVVPAGVVIGTAGVLTFAGEGAVDCEVLELWMAYGSTGIIGATLQTALGDRIRLVARGQR
jgi:hypothetical protein